MGGNESILLFFHEISFHSIGPACASNFALKCRSETPPFLSPLELINQPTSWPISGGGRKADFVLIRSIVVTPVCVNAWRIFPFFFFFLIRFLSSYLYVKAWDFCVASYRDTLIEAWVIKCRFATNSNRLIFDRWLLNAPTFCLY